MVDSNKEALTKLDAEYSQALLNILLPWILSLHESGASIAEARSHVVDVLIDTIEKNIKEKE